MSYKIAVASSDGVKIDLHFGNTNEFTIVNVNDDGSLHVSETRRVSEQDSHDTHDETSDANIPCKNSSGSNSGCGNHSSGGCGTGHSDSKIEARVNTISDCRCLLCNKIGPGAERQLERKAITTFQIDLSLEDALVKIIEYYTKLDNHVSLRKTRIH